MTAKKTYTRPDTVLAVAGRDPASNFGIVNPPVYHASTILSPTMEKFENRVPFEGFGYGRNGTPTQKALEDAVAAIEGAHRSIAVQSGLGAVTGAIVGFLKTGEHMLLTDNAYGAALRQYHTQEFRRRDHLLRSHGRRRHRATDAAEHQGGLSRSARLTDLRGAGCRRHRRRRQETRRDRADRQYLGHAALLQAVR